MNATANDAANSVRKPEGPVSDWQWQMSNRVCSVDELASRFPQLAITDGMRVAAERYPFAVTPYYLSLIKEPSPADPIYRQCVPDARELIEGNELAPDELEESSTYSPVRGLVRRYTDRAVCLSTSMCPTYCRHCTRKRLVGRPQFQPTPAELDEQARYVREHPEIKDVIISGGDPLAMTTEQLEAVLARFRPIPSVDIIRIGTRAPVTLPMRVDEELCAMLERYQPVWVNTQFNHPREITPASAAACERLLRHGIPVCNQAVLLRGVNDDPATMEELSRALLRIRVKPYYLLQCDPVAGIGHFRTPVASGVAIMKHLFKAVGGLGVPRFVVDAADGGGKVPIDPSYVVEHEAGRLVLRNFEDETVTYPDLPPDCSAGSSECPQDPRRASPRPTSPSPHD